MCVDSGGELIDSFVVLFVSFGIIFCFGCLCVGVYVLRRVVKRRKVGGVKFGTRIVGVFN